MNADQSHTPWGDARSAVLGAWLSVAATIPSPQSFRSVRKHMFVSDKVIIPPPSPSLRRHSEHNLTEEIKNDLKIKQNKINRFLNKSERVRGLFIKTMSANTNATVRLHLWISVTMTHLISGCLHQSDESFRMLYCRTKVVILEQCATQTQDMNWDLD